MFRSKPDNTKIDRHEAAWKAMRVALLCTRRRFSTRSISDIIQMLEVEFEVGSSGELIKAIKEDMES